MNNERNHLLDILELIDNLQKSTTGIDNNLNNSCSNPILGSNNILLANTRPIMFYLCNNEPLSINFEGNETSTTVFRIEDVNNNLVTLRLLSQEDTTITSSNEFATININCIAAIRCLQDVSLTL